ncbi:MAG: ankyrin repeat domain-containing protein [Candidatus Goldbacteria bacterium]|nr:ankyrin repeat domain-containing protein [Candidatus Goldiibacteriota bacterium]
MLNKLDEELFNAIIDEDVIKVGYLISMGANVNAVNKDEDTPLLLACTCGELSAVSVLIPEIFGSFDYIFMGNKEKYFQIVKILINSGADVNKVTEKSNISPLYVSVFTENLEVIKYLIESGADVNFKGGINSRTPLINAALFGKANVVHLLLMAGADASIKDKNGLTALDLSINKNIKAIISEFWLPDKK